MRKLKTQLVKLPTIRERRRRYSTKCSIIHEVMKSHEGADEAIQEWSLNIVRKKDSWE